MQNIIMSSVQEEEFPFEELLEALSQQEDLSVSLRHMIAGVRAKNIYWTYSIFSTLVEILRSRQEQPGIKCRALQAVHLLFDTYEYPVMVLAQVYLLPILVDIALFTTRNRGLESSHYFQETFEVPITQSSKRLSVHYVERAVELIYYAAKIKPLRNVETQEIKQDSNFAKAVANIESMGLSKPTKWRFVDQEKYRECRKEYLNLLKTFPESSERWAEFLVVNLMQEVKTGEAELLQLRQLLSFGQFYLTSPITNVCEDQLMQITSKISLKRKYLSILHQLIRHGDIQAIITVKNSDFVPNIAAHFSQFHGNIGLAQGQFIYPEVEEKKQTKMDFYCDFLRCLETWAKTIPYPQYDTDEFTINGVYEMLKVKKKFIFPQNLHLGRFEKQLKQNLQLNKPRNNKLMQVLESVIVSRQNSRSISLKKSFSMQRAQQKKEIVLESGDIEDKLQEAKREVKQLMEGEEKAKESFKQLVYFKDNWVNYLDHLNIDGQDEERLQQVIVAGQKLVEQIQVIVPVGNGLQKGKLTYQQFKQRIKETVNFHNELNRSNSMNRGDETLKSNRSKVVNSRFGRSRVMSRGMLDKIRNSNMVDNESGYVHKNSKVMNRSNMVNSMRHHDVSKPESKLGLDFSKKDEVVVLGQIEHNDSKHEERKSNKGDVSVVSVSGASEQSAVSKQSSKVSHSHRSRDNVYQSPKSKSSKLMATPDFPGNYNHSQKRSVRMIPEYCQTKEEKPSLKDSVVSKDSQSSKRSKVLLRRGQQSKNPSKLSSKKQIKQEESVMLSSRGSQSASIKQMEESFAQPQALIPIVGKVSPKDPFTKVESRLKSKVVESPYQKSIQPKISDIIQQQSPKFTTQQHVGSKLSKVSSSQNFTSVNKMHQLASEPVISAQSQVRSLKKARSSHELPSEKPLNEDSMIQSRATYKGMPEHNETIQIASKVASNHEIQTVKKGTSGFSEQQRRTHQGEIRVMSPSEFEAQAHSNHNSAKMSLVSFPKGSKYEPVTSGFQAAPPIPEENSQQDVILGPDGSPAQYSYHPSTKSRPPSDIVDFKEIFNPKHELFESKQFEERLLKHNSGLKNVIKANKHTDIKQPVLSKLASFDKKFSYQRSKDSQGIVSGNPEYGLKSYRSVEELQSQKNRQIAELMSRVEQLQKQQSSIKSQLAQKDNQLRSVRNQSLKSRSINGSSSRGFMDFTSPTHTHFQQSKNSRLEQQSRKSSSKSRRSGSVSPFTREIQGPFKQYLEKIKGSNLKKSLLRHKCLITKNQELQIGLLTKRTLNGVEGTIFLTANRFNLADFSITAIHDANLKVIIQEPQNDLIEVGKQNRIKLFIEVLRIPFGLPEIQINYKATSGYASGYSRLPLPIGFNKLCEIKPLDDDTTSMRSSLSVRSDPFSLNTKVVKMDKLKESLPSLTIVRVNKSKNHLLAAGQCNFQDSLFNIYIHLREEDSWIEAVLLEGESATMNYLLCTYKVILEGPKR